MGKAPSGGAPSAELQGQGASPGTRVLPLLGAAGTPRGVSFHGPPAPSAQLTPGAVGNFPVPGPCPGGSGHPGWQPG